MTLEGTVPAAGVTEVWTLEFVDGLGSPPMDSHVASNAGLIPPTNTRGISIRVTGEPIEVSIDDVAVVESDTGTVNAVFSVTLSAASSAVLYLDYTTVSGTATAGVDYENTFGTLIFEPGQTSRTVVVPIFGDRRQELDETFSLVVTSTSPGVDMDDIGLATILDEDGRNNEHRRGPRGRGRWA